MLETLLVIILLPVAIISGLIMIFVSWLLWKYILAILLWIVSGMFLIYAWSAKVDVTWWIVGFLIAGCLMWAWATMPTEKKPKVLIDK